MKDIFLLFLNSWGSGFWKPCQENLPKCCKHWLNPYPQKSLAIFPGSPPKGTLGALGQTSAGHATCVIPSWAAPVESPLCGSKRDMREGPPVQDGCVVHTLVAQRGSHARRGLAAWKWDCWWASHWYVLVHCEALDLSHTFPLGRTSEQNCVGFLMSLCVYL